MNRKALKRTAALVALPLLLVACSVAFAACAEKSDGTFPDGASMTLILATEPESVLSVDLSGMDEDVCLLDVLDSENIGYEMSGTLVNAVDGITLGSGEYIYFYAGLEALTDEEQELIDSEKEAAGIEISDEEEDITSLDDGTYLYRISVATGDSQLLGITDYEERHSSYQYRA